MAAIAVLLMSQTLALRSSIGKRLTADDDKTCILRQNCVRTTAQEGLPCPDPMDVEAPSPTPFAPAPITDSTGINDLAVACPFLNPASNLCCGSDTAAVMKSNYQSLDAVFFNDCPICAVNLKTMWCEYACNEFKDGFRK